MWDFVKNAVVDDVNTVPEQFRGLYEKNAENKFGISASGKAIVDMYVGTNASLEKSRKDLAAANGEAASRRVTKNAVIEFAKKLGLENIDEDNPLTNLETHFTDLAGKLKNGGDLKVNLENIKADYARRNAELKTASDKELGDMRRDLEEHLIGNATLAALSKHGGNATLLSPVVKGVAKVVKDENGKYVVRILDDTGAPRSNGAGGWLDLDGYVGDLKAQPVYAPAFASDTKSGTGKKPGFEQPVRQQQNGEKTAAQKIEAGLARQQAERGRANA
jgi:hypothetical protein